MRARTVIEKAGGSVAYRIGYGDLTEPMYEALAERELVPAVHGAFVRLACEKVGAGDSAWWADLAEGERTFIAGLLAALDDEEAGLVAEAIREGLI